MDNPATWPPPQHATSTETSRYGTAVATTPQDAATFGDAVLLSVPWPRVPDAEQTVPDESFGHLD